MRQDPENRHDLAEEQPEKTQHFPQNTLHGFYRRFNLCRTIHPPGRLRIPLFVTASFILLLAGGSVTSLLGQEPDPTSEDVVMMEAFSVTIYGGKIPLIDGFTGKRYEGDNKLLFDFANSFNKLLLFYHKRLLTKELEHLKFREELSKRFEEEMNALTTSFELGEFKLDETNLLVRERAIVSRLAHKPFFKINAVVAWDVDKLNALAPARPSTKYAKDIRLNPETVAWERRIMTRWDVFFRRNQERRSDFFTDKQQGLNLDTLKGFHFIEIGLPSDVPPNAFQDVDLTYPVFFSDANTGKAELERLQKTFLANLHFIYDPFSWLARRERRFRGGFKRDCREHIQGERVYVTDRDWFDRVLPDFFSDVVTIKLQGADEIYSYHLLAKRINESPRTLGIGLDLLNWNNGEKREGTEEPEAAIRLHAKSTSGFRFVMIEAYQRFGDTLVDMIRTRLLAQKQTRGKTNGEVMLQDIIAELSGLRYEQFRDEAIRNQQEQLERHRVTR